MSLAEMRAFIAAVFAAADDRGCPWPVFAYLAGRVEAMYACMLAFVIVSVAVKGLSVVVRTAELSEVATRVMVRMAELRVGRTEVLVFLVAFASTHRRVKSWTGRVNCSLPRKSFQK